VIPPEARFSEARRVSRATVRQAFYELRLEGYVVREEGRGTFIGLSDSNNVGFRLWKSRRQEVEIH
jgi:DNA-binding GntR family transcriptional regulator